jgi:hypothetical protein
VAFLDLCKFADLGKRAAPKDGVRAGFWGGERCGNFFADFLNSGLTHLARRGILEHTFASLSARFLHDPFLHPRRAPVGNIRKQHSPDDALLRLEALLGYIENRAPSDPYERALRRIQLAEILATLDRVLDRAMAILKEHAGDRH